MGREGDPRITIRCTPAEHEALERCARVAGVATGALVRQVALRWGPFFAAEVATNRQDIRATMRSRNASAS